jgi:hypothetical protein
VTEQCCKSHFWYSNWQRLSRLRFNNLTLLRLFRIRKLLRRFRDVLQRRWGSTNKQIRMNPAITADARGRLSASPPLFKGLSRKSPTVAPNGRVKLNAVQNWATREKFVQK